MDKKISQLTGATTPLTGTEELAIVQGGSTVKATAQDVADLAGGALPVSNTYPVTTPASAGTRFWYKGNEWHYMTSDEIASAGWTGLVSVGFPAPVSKTYNANIFTDFTGLTSSFTNGVSPIYSPAISAYTTVDCLGIGNPTRVRFFSISASGQAASIRNAQLLINVEDQGTAQGIYIGFNQFSSTALNNFFTDLPATIKTVTIYAANNPGSATCNPAIATAKGYTVVV
jgi:hypothetical protein